MTNPHGEQTIPRDYISPKDAEYFSKVVEHTEAREKSRLVSIFAGQLNALNEDRRKNLAYVFGRED